METGGANADTFVVELSHKRVAAMAVEESRNNIVLSGVVVSKPISYTSQQFNAIQIKSNQIKRLTD